MRRRRGRPAGRRRAACTGGSRGRTRRRSTRPAPCRCGGRAPDASGTATAATAPPSQSVAPAPAASGRRSGTTGVLERDPPPRPPRSTSATKSTPSSSKQQQQQQNDSENSADAGLVFFVTVSGYVIVEDAAAGEGNGRQSAPVAAPARFFKRHVIASGLPRYRRGESASPFSRRE